MEITGKRCLIIGASSGIGAALAQKLGERGCILALVARRLTELTAVADKINKQAERDAAFIYPADVTDFLGTKSLLHKIMDDLGGLDLVVYVSGIISRPETDTFDTISDMAIIDVNFLGAVVWLNPVAELFTGLHAGTIVGIGSVAGDRGRGAFPAYSASKAALDTYLEALRNRLAQHGVQVTTIKPGTVNTSMTASSKVSRLAASPESTALNIIKAIEHNATIAYTPFYWKPIMSLIKLLPSSFMQKKNY